MKRILVAAALVAAGSVGSGCSKSPEQAKPAPADSERNDVIYLSPMQHLIRLSLDVRGTRPTIAEIEDVERNPERVRFYAHEFLADPRFAERVKEIWNEALLTRQDRPYFPGPPQMIGVRTEDEFARAAGNEPLELIAHVVTGDRPFTEIVNGSYTVANDVLEAYYDIERPQSPAGASGTEWVTTATGTPSGCCPLQPSVMSKSLRPTTSAPSLPWKSLKNAASSDDSEKLMSSRAVSKTMSPLLYHPNSSLMPSCSSATNPSIDIVAFTTTLLMSLPCTRARPTVLSSDVRGPKRQRSQRSSHGRPMPCWQRSEGVR